MKRRARLIPSRRKYSSLLLRQSSKMEPWSIGEIELRERKRWIDAFSSKVFAPQLSQPVCNRLAKHRLMPSSAARLQVSIPQSKAAANHFGRLHPPPRVRRSPGSGAYVSIGRTQESVKSGSTRAMALRIGFCCRAQPTSTTSDNETTRLHRNILRGST